TAFDSVPAEAAKDRSSIRLMDLPMQQPKKKKLSSSSPDTPSQDTKNLPSAAEEATSARVVTSIPRTASTSDPVGTSDQQQTLQQQQQEAQDQAQDRDLQQQQQLSEQQAVHLKTLDNQVEKPKPVVESTRVATVEMGSGSSSQPSRYETREERQIRIRKQFNQLDQKRSGFLDANSLVSFFADITPDKNVQRRYADELLQLCHSRRSRDHHHHHHHHHHNTNGNGNGNGSHDSGNGSSHGNGHENGGGSPDSDSPDDSNSRDDDHQNCNGDHGDEDDDGHVRYDDFDVFVEEKEERLWNLLREIDHNNDNEIQPEELQASLAKAGINLSDADLQRFIKAMDKIFRVQLPSNLVSDGEMVLRCALQASGLDHGMFIDWFHNDATIKNRIHPVKDVINALTSGNTLWSSPIPENESTYQICYVNPIILALFSFIGS
ncbi:hypothetical protein B0O80DRAFT_476595, partial [Mortierella sp. GBAus27b]